MTEARITDWLDALSGFPRFAIANAVKAWHHGEQGQRKPVPASIVALCRKEVAVVRAAVDQGKRMNVRAVPEPTSNRITADHAAAIIAEVAAKRSVSE